MRIAARATRWPAYWTLWFLLSTWENNFSSMPGRKPAQEKWDDIFRMEDISTAKVAIGNSQNCMLACRTANHRYLAFVTKKSPVFFPCKFLFGQCCSWQLACPHVLRRTVVFDSNGRKKKHYRPLYRGLFVACAPYFASLKKSGLALKYKWKNTSRNSRYCARLNDVKSWHISKPFTADSHNETITKMRQTQGRKRHHTSASGNSHCVCPVWGFQ